MATFAKRTQAREIVSGLVTRSPRTGLKPDGQIRSIGTERDYTTTFAAIAEWGLGQKKAVTLARMTRTQALAYLEERRGAVGQKTLDRDRTLLNRLPRIKTPLPHVQSTKAAGRLSQGSRAYEGGQIVEIASRQNARHALSTRLAWRCGLRAHEMYTLKRHDRLSKSELRRLSGNDKWDGRRLQGRDGVRYTVTGKGGLMRVVIVPRELARELEARYVRGGFKTQDRRIYYRQFYDIGGGQKWSSSFSTASKRAFGFSLGGHACRHTYAQDRLSEYREAGFSYREARALVSQELGHFRERVTATYLR